MPPDPTPPPMTCKVVRSGKATEELSFKTAINIFRYKCLIVKISTIRDTDVSKSLIAASDEAVNQPLSSHSRATTTLKYPCPSIYSQKRGEIYHLLLQFFTILKALFVKSSIGMLDIMVKVTYEIHVAQQMILSFFINIVNIFTPRICAFINGISNLLIFGIKFRV